MSNKKTGKWYEESTKVRPSKVNGIITTRTDFYRTVVLRKIVKGLFEIKCPDNWDRDFMLNLLIDWGYFVITDSPIGVMPFRATLKGINYIGNPTQALITTPVLPTMERTLNKDCSLIYLDRNPSKMFFTFRKLFDIYAEKFASADCSIDVNLMNSRVGYIVEAETKAQAETMKKAYDEIVEGNPFIVYRKDALTPSGMQVFFGNVKQNYVADLVQDTKRTIMNEFLTILGINNANTDKKERLITGEVDSNLDELACNTYWWVQNLKKNVEQTKKLFPNLEFDITLKFDQSKRKEAMNEVYRDDRSMDTSES